ncbi:MAG: hypothetical protein J5829_06240 [Lachnospiraceae bacterium]|nr:hypothetical protein [Lachnospiraceae bacterium]
MLRIRRFEQLNEDELVNVSGGRLTEQETDVAPCPKCGGVRKKNGNRIICSKCGYTVVMKNCPSCKTEKECEEYSGGRFKCTVCNTIF